MIRVCVCVGVFVCVCVRLNLIWRINELEILIRSLYLVVLNHSENVFTGLYTHRFTI